MALFGKKEPPPPPPDPNVVRVRPELNCCATCLWWMGKRNYVKQTEQITETKKGRTDIFIRVNKTETGQCANVKMDQQYGTDYPPSYHCTGYQSWFVNGIPNQR